MSYFAPLIKHVAASKSLVNKTSLSIVNQCATRRNYSAGRYLCITSSVSERHPSSELQKPANGGDQDIRDLPGLTPEQHKLIHDKDNEHRTRHFGIEAALGGEERDLVRRKRMIYRSKQRGWLEADLLMGSWAVENVPNLTEAELDEYELLLKEETIDTAGIKKLSELTKIKTQIAKLLGRNIG